MKIFKVEPFFSERLWGGSKLQEWNFNVPKDKKIGEAWLISALENGMSHITQNNKKITFKEFYENNKSLFGIKNDVFPLLSKIITAEDNLSIQVHPDDEYSLKHENMLGKPECWYILDCPENAELILGHSAKNKQELEQMVHDAQWDKLFTKVKIKKGDFVYVPPGKIHAITKGVSVFELQRSSDITYRFYDYDRKDKDGNLRELHIKKSIDTTLVPDTDLNVINKDNGELISNDFFKLFVFSQNTKLDLKDNKFCQITVVEGTLEIDNQTFNSGESLLICDINKKLMLNVNGKILLSHY